jgi:hypothetical protein
LANPIGNHSAAGVYLQEINLSAVIQNVAVSVGAAVGYSLRGPLTPTFVTDYPTYRQYFGPSNTQTQGFLALSVRDYFANGGTGCWILRTPSSASPPTYSGALLQNIGSPAQVQLTPIAVANPNAINWATAGGATSATNNLGYFYGIGPGSWYGNIAISLGSSNITIPQGVATQVNPPGSSGSTGTLPAGTYQYAVSALSSTGETQISVIIPATVSTANSSVTIGWNYVAGAIGYRVYATRGTNSQLYLLATVGQPQTSPNLQSGGVTVPTTASYTDIGSTVNTSIIPPGQNSPSLIRTSSQFQVNVYDLTQSQTSPVEVYNVTLQAGTNASNNQTEIASVINGSSKNISFLSNVTGVVAAGGTLPVIPPVTAVQLAAGVDDTLQAVADADFVNGWNIFQDQDTYQITQLLNCGNSDPVIQSAMISLAAQRKDCVAFCDVPSTQQAAVNATAYRLTQLNYNTDRGMLFTSDLQELDPDTNQLVWVPPSGAIAGVAAGADNNSGAGTSIAGPSYGALSNVVKLRYSYGAQTDQDAMASVQVNYIRNKQGIGVYLNEQKTMLTALSALSFYPVRRMFDVLENSVKQAMYYYQGAPNIVFTAQQISAMVTQYLNTLVSAQKINGFAVQIDNSPAVRAQGQILVYMAIEPTLPINQIGIVAIITPQGANFAQILASVTGSGLSSGG